MARPLRIEYAGAVYHVMARGNQGRPIYADDLDRKRWLETLEEAWQKTGWRIHAYVLMRNHYHLLVQTPEPNLSAGMKWLQSTYTSRFNRRHKVYGHLFQGRYKAVPVDGTEPGYFQVVSTYIHLNPARAKLVLPGRDRLKAYQWSSYPWYLSKHAPVWLSRERVMGSLGLRPGERKRYQASLERRMLELANPPARKELEAQWKDLRRGWYVGSEKFQERLAAWLDKTVTGRRRDSHTGAARRAHDEQAAGAQLKRGLKALGLKPAELGRLGKGTPEKTVLAWWLRRSTTVTLSWTAERLGMGHASRVSQAVARMRHRPGRRLRSLQRKLLNLEDRIEARYSTKCMQDHRHDKRR